MSNEKYRLTSKAIDLYEYPQSQLLPRHGKQEVVTIADTHGNLINLINKLQRLGIITITENDYRALYDCMFDDSGDDQIEAIIERITVNRGSCGLLRFLGDNLAERGAMTFNDMQMLMLFKKLEDGDINYEVTYSNHDMDFVQVYLNNFENDNNCQVLQEQRWSLDRLLRGIRSGQYEKKDVLSLAKSYISKIKFVSCEVDEDTKEIRLYSHAPLNLDYLLLGAKEQGLVLNFSSKGKILNSINRLNEFLQECFNKGKSQEDFVNRLVWNRGGEEEGGYNEEQKMVDGYIITNIYGHVGGQPNQHANSINLDSELGKTSQSPRGYMNIWKSPMAANSKIVRKVVCLVNQKKKKSRIKEELVKFSFTSLEFDAVFSKILDNEDDKQVANNLKRFLTVANSINGWEPDLENMVQNSLISVASSGDQIKIQMALDVIQHVLGEDKREYLIELVQKLALNNEVSELELGNIICSMLLTSRELGCLFSQILATKKQDGVIKFIHAVMYSNHQSNVDFMLVLIDRMVLVFGERNMVDRDLAIATLQKALTPGNYKIMLLSLIRKLSMQQNADLSSIVNSEDFDTHLTDILVGDGKNFSIEFFPTLVSAMINNRKQNCLIDTVARLYKKEATRDVFFFVLYAIRKVCPNIETEILEQAKKYIIEKRVTKIKTGIEKDANSKKYKLGVFGSSAKINDDEVPRGMKKIYTKICDTRASLSNTLLDVSKIAKSKTASSGFFKPPRSKETVEKYSQIHTKIEKDHEKIDHLDIMLSNCQRIDH